MPHITRHLLVPEAPQAGNHESLVGAGGCHGPRGGSEPSRLAHRAQTRTQGRRGVWCTRPDAPCGARSGCCPWCRDRREIFVGVSDSHGRAVVLSPLGVRIALVARTCLGRGGQLCNRRTAWLTVVSYEDGPYPTRNPPGRGRQPRAVRAAHPLSARTSRSYRTCLGVGGFSATPWGTARSMQ